MDYINRRRLEWMRDAVVGEIFPTDLFAGPDKYTGWSHGVSAACKAALEEIHRLRTCTIYHSWQLIETAPVEPWDKVPSYYRFKCLLQIPHRSDPPFYVTAGYAYYVCAPRSKEARILRWHDGSHQCFPKYWMPLPAAKQE